MAIGPFVWGAGGAPVSYEELQRLKALEEQQGMKGGDFSPVGHWTQGAGRVLDALGGVVRKNRLDGQLAEADSYNADLLKGWFGGGQPAATGGAAPSPSMSGTTAPVSGGDDLRSGIVSTAQALGIDPVDLATAISYETAGTFDPTKAGPTTQWGQHRGLIQFGEPQAKQYGVDWSNPVGSQLGPDGAVAKYLRETGVKPGMGMLDIYSAINAGGVGRYNASDANNGGAPGTVADKVNNQMAGHRQKALALLGGEAAPAVYRGELAGMMPGQLMENPVGRPNPNENPRDLIQPLGAGVQVASLGDDPNPMLMALAQRAGTAPKSGPALRPFRSNEQLNNADGSYSTEITTTWQTPNGEWVNVPSLWMGPDGPQQFDPDDERGILGAMQAYEGANGPSFQRFPTVQAAEAAARARSLSGGASGPPRAGQMPDQQRVAQALTQAPAQQQGGTSQAALLEALTNPRTSPQVRSVAAALLQQQQAAAAQANDPMRRLQLEKLELENESLRNPISKPTSDIQEYEYAKSQGFQGTLADYQQAIRRAGSPINNVNVGEGDKFYENLDKKNADTFAALSDGGMKGRARVAQINQLEQLLNQSPTGAGAQVKLWLGDMGINTEGLDDLQATRALIERLVPEQRAPGSGPMSDADIEMYRRSLPTVVNQPGGNAMIIGTARAIAQYDMEMGSIADAVADREITPAEGRKRIRELQNPLDGYREMLRSLNPGKGTSAQNSGAKAVTDMSDAELEAIVNGQR